MESEDYNDAYYFFKEYDLEIMDISDNEKFDIMKTFQPEIQVFKAKVEELENEIKHFCDDCYSRTN